MSSQQLRVVVFFSGGASALRYLAKEDNNFGVGYKIVGAFTDKPDASGRALARAHGIEVARLDFRAWSKQRGTKRNDMTVRADYFDEVSQLIAGFKADIIMLSGFMLILKGQILVDYAGKILNVHPADLTVLDEDGRRKYRGDDAVRLAMEVGATSTCSTVHFVTDGVDEGAILVVSDPLPVVPGTTPEEHQEKMKWECDGPAYAEALRILSSRQ
ncbi:MAG: hypothetical protein HOH01_00575 [Candidatus Jacksonbacteria bacterium]|nr:hypothetical protein [Candidatus Jacksonbacteria bacterium]MBT6955558.1 hypothetical protein [Candidatus Jacksonbacteria bacterium]